MIKVGITGQVGFVGTHLYNELGLFPETFERVSFEDSFFESEDCLKGFVKKCDVIVHLAAMNRHPDEEVIYSTNIRLVEQLIKAMNDMHVSPHVLFSSSTQEKLDNLYGQSKRKGRELLENWAVNNQGSFSGLVVPNVYGPFGMPNYNSFIATFCYKLTHNEVPTVIIDNEVSLIYVGSLCKFIINRIIEIAGNKNRIEKVTIESDFVKSVSEILSLLIKYKELYLKSGFIPVLRDQNEINLFNTFRSYIDNKKYFPVSLTRHADERGVFVETIKLGTGGQVSFSTTVPGITRGNHYHSRKIERFTVIKGKALIQLRKIGTDKVIDFYLDGENPSYVDMPIWYTHNIKNIGEDDLYTQFWINEWYDPNDGDTYFETV